LNIVKVRYLDPPVFVDVGNVVTSYTLTQNASVGGTIVPNGGSNVMLGIGALPGSERNSFSPKMARE
jgi:hypothetical protein